MKRHHVITHDLSEENLLRGRFEFAAVGGRAKGAGEAVVLKELRRVTLGETEAAAPGAVGFAGSTAVGLLPSHCVLTKYIRVPRMAEPKLGKIVSFEASKQLPWESGQVTWMHRVAAEYESGLEVMLAAAKRNVVENYLGRLESNRMGLCALVPAWMALLRVYRGVVPENEGVGVIVGVRRRGTTLLFVGQGCFHVRMLAQGDPAAADETPAWNAERIAREMARTEAAVGWLGGKLAGARVWVSAGHEMGEALLRELTGVLGRAVEPLPVSSAVKDRTPDGAWAKLGGGEQAELLGAALLAREKADGCLLPAEWKNAQTFRKGRPWYIAGMLVAVLLAGASNGIVWNKAVAVSGEERSLRGKLEPMERVERANKEGMAKLEALNKEVRDLKTLVDRKGEWVRLFTSLEAIFAGKTNARILGLRELNQKDDGRREPEGIRGARGRRLVLRGAVGVTMPEGKAELEGRARYQDVRDLLQSIGRVQGVVAVENEHFDETANGVEFDCELVLGESPGGVK